MSTFICSVCGCVDNTALYGNYWILNQELFSVENDYFNKNIVCSECCPTKYKDGTTKKNSGKWHNEFEKMHWTRYGTREELIALCNEGQGNFVNASNYFKTRR